MRQGRVNVFALSIMLFLASMTPLFFQTNQLTASQFEKNVQPLPPIEGSGINLNGQTIQHNGVDWDVRPETIGQNWVYKSWNANNTIRAFDIVVEANGKAHICYIEGLDVVYRSETIYGLEHSLQISTLSTATANDACSIDLTSYGRANVVFYNNSDVMFSRQVFESTSYDEETWNTRIIDQNVAGGPLELYIDGEEKPHVVFRDSNQSLRLLHYSGSFWSKEILVNEPILPDVEIDGFNQEIEILCTVQSTNSMKLFTSSGDSFVPKEVSSFGNLTGQIGMSVDQNGVKQIAYAYESGDQSYINLLQSLRGKVAGKIGSSPILTLPAGVTERVDYETVFDTGDYNGDGYEDLVIGREGLWGAIALYSGSAEGLNQTSAFSLVGNESFSSIASPKLLDFNGDGFDDLVFSVRANQLGNASVFVHLGGQEGISDEPWWELSSSNSMNFGYQLLDMGDTNGDGFTDLGIIDRFESNRTISLYHGNASVPQSHAILSKSSTTTGNGFGENFATRGDINGDGYADFAVSNTGNESSPINYSSVEVFLGSIDGIDTSPHRIYQSNKQGRLFGHEVAFIGDVDNDGDDELLISEIFNNTNEKYQAGKLWLFSGNTSGLDLQPSWIYDGESANDRIGYSASGLGDINDDGFDDFMVSKLKADQSGEIEIFLGSDSGPKSEQYLLKSGSMMSRLSSSISGGHDFNADGAVEVVLTQKNMTTGNLDVHVLSEREWEYVDLETNGTVEALELGITYDLRTLIMASIDNSTILFQRTMDGSPEGRWVSNQIFQQSSLITSSFSISPSGQSWILSSGINQLLVAKSSHHTILERTLLNYGGFGSNLDIASVDHLKQHLVYQSRPANSVWYSSSTDGTWSSPEQIGSVTLTLATPLQLHVDSENNPHVLMLDQLTGDLYLAKKSISWSIELKIASSGLESFSSTMLDNGTLFIAGITNQTSTPQAKTWYLQEQNVTEQSHGEVASTSIIEIQRVSSNDTALFLLDGNHFKIFHAQMNTSSWSMMVNSSMGQVGQMKYLVSSETAVAVHGNDSTKGIWNLNNGTWFYHHIDLPKLEHPSLLLSETDFILTGKDTTNGFMIWALGNLSFNSSSVIDFPSLNPESAIPLSFGLNDSINAAWRDPSSLDLELMKWLPDFDGDFIPDAHDQLDDVPGQWVDEDGDGYGENPLGPYSDDCLSISGTSYFVVQGCIDSDGDGFGNDVDDCLSVSGSSWWNALGCKDTDQDGWNDLSGEVITGDKWPTNWKQAIDSDGDGYGDNHGPDCCDTSRSNAIPDWLPFNDEQWEDRDMDGFGDNQDYPTGDKCIWIYGTSWRDRNGCLDTDGDGSSDPSNIGTKTEWNIEDGADMWINDPTQWQDTDGDGHGDNASDLAINPDKFPLNITATDDADNDGFPDAWTSFVYQSNSSNENEPPLYLDYCPGVTGFSTNPVGKYGCIDSDGDTWADIYDAFPSDKNQWSDQDGDGFGDQPGPNYDQCPSVKGVIEGTGGQGCPLGDDEDLDGVVDTIEPEACLNTEFGLEVDTIGCADNQLDDDNDGVNNHIDLCSDTIQGASSVDDDGCSEEQRNQDSDNDSVYDPYDDCPETPSSEIANPYGCSASQRDSDGDLVTDDIDQCPETTPGYLVDETGCIDDSCLEQDCDGDGYSGIYEVDLSGIEPIHSGDAFPFDASQWWDLDGDNFGDNPAGNESDKCPEEPGNSTYGTSIEIEYFGCPDDGDGFADKFEPSSLRNDPTQWSDMDFDDYGDNPDGNNPDLCPNTDELFRAFVDENGCAENQLDSDEDGVTDDRDVCPNTLSGKEVYADDGCAKSITSESVSSSVTVLGFTVVEFSLIIVGVLFGLIILLILIRRMNRSDDFEGWDDEDEDDEEEDYDSFLDDFYSGNLPTRQPQNVNRTSPSPPVASPRGPASHHPLQAVGQQVSLQHQANRAGPVGLPPRGGAPSRGPPTSPPQQNRPPSGPTRTSPGPSHPPQQNRPPSGPARTSPGPSHPPQQNRPPGGPARSPPGQTSSVRQPAPSRSAHAAGYSQYTAPNQPPRSTPHASQTQHASRGPDPRGPSRGGREISYQSQANQIPQSRQLASTRTSFNQPSTNQGFSFQTQSSSPSSQSTGYASQTFSQKPSEPQQASRRVRQVARSNTPAQQAHSTQQPVKRAVRKAVTSTQYHAQQPAPQQQVAANVFASHQIASRDSAVQWVKGQIHAGANERNILMQLQNIGWTAPQSRAILEMGR